MGINLDETFLTRDALADHYQRFQPEIYSYILRITRDRDAAEDLTGDTFRKVLEKRDSYNGKSFRNWVYSIARNTTLDHLRARGVRTAFQNGARHVVNEDHSVEEEKNESSFKGGIEYVLGLSWNNPEESVIVKEQLRKLYDFIDIELTEKIRDAYNLHLQGYSDMEVGQMLGIKEQAVTSRIHRARIKIREYAAEHLTA